MRIKVFLFIYLVNLAKVKGSIQYEIPNLALDHKLYEEVIDREKCAEQIAIIRNNTFLTMFFADAGIRVPKGLLIGNTLDLGNYHQCLNIAQPLPNDFLQGKYCVIRVPGNQTLQMPQFSTNQFWNFDPKKLQLDEKTEKKLAEYENMRKGMLAMTGIEDERMLPNNPLAGFTFRVAVCVPRPCTTEQAINSFLFNISAVGFQYTDDFCRLPDDKPWVAGDTVAVVVFSLIGLITLISTSYDIWQTIILKNDAKTVSVIGRAFSLYTNGRRLMNFSSSPDTIECLDGIRALAMAWVLLGHTFTSEISWANPLDSFEWSRSWEALWVTAAHITVDTFFTLSGFLVVYTTLGKLNGMQLLKNIHLFWLNRLLRMFPLLATAVLLEATYLNRMADGPIWSGVAGQVQRCRAAWWATLLHIQNYAARGTTCIGQTWYLAIDVQLHILSPIVLFWLLLGKKRIAWTALLIAVVGILVASSTYIFIKEFPSTMMSRPERISDYMHNYYINTLTRAPAFIVGMLFGYLVRTTKLDMPKISSIISWVLLFGLSTFITYTNLPIAQQGWDNQLADNLVNSFVRPAWAAFLGCLIYACVNGYGGPINWFLSLSVWKIHSRLSYAMYLFHYGLMTAVNFTAVAPAFFSVGLMTFKFLAHYALSFAVSFLMVLVIDAPFSTLFKLLLGGGPKKPRKKEEDIEPTKENDKQV